MNPIHQLAHRCWLVAIGHRIDDPLFLCLLGQDRSAHHIGLDVDHDDILAVLDRHQRMAHTGQRVACRLNDAFDALEGAEVGRAVGDESPPGIHRISEGRRRMLDIFPARARQGLADLGDIKIGNGHNVIARDFAGLRQNHRAKFACPDQADADGLSGGTAPGKDG